MIARLVAMPLEMQAVPRLITTSSTFFHKDHANISTDILLIPLIQEEQLSVNGKRRAVVS